LFKILIIINLNYQLKALCEVSNLPTDFDSAKYGIESFYLLDMVKIFF